MSNLKPCPFCFGRAVILPVPELKGEAVRAQCLSCRAHTKTIDAQRAGDLRSAFKIALLLWNERKIEK